MDEVQHTQDNNPSSTTAGPSRLHDQDTPMKDATQTRQTDEIAPTDIEDILDDIQSQVGDTNLSQNDVHSQDAIMDDEDPPFPTPAQRQRPRSVEMEMPPKQCVVDMDINLDNHGGDLVPTQPAGDDEYDTGEYIDIKIVSISSYPWPSLRFPFLSMPSCLSSHTPSIRIFPQFDMHVELRTFHGSSMSVYVFVYRSTHTHFMFSLNSTCMSD